MRGIREKVGTDLVLIPSVTGAIFDSASRLLLAKHPDGLWTMPGGALDPGESPAQGVVREVSEETGLEVLPRKILGVFGGQDFFLTYPNGDELAYIMTVFECELVGGVARPDMEEVFELGYFTLEEMAGLKVPHWTQSVFTRIFERPSEAAFDGL
jgi:8-oxo-dGTP pyrophosphatase MutT (NUDIX family)